MAQYRRTKKLIDPKLQLKLVLLFMTSAGVGVLVQSIMLTWSLSKIALEVPNDGELVRSMLPGLLTSNLVITFALLLPAMFALGILATFRVAGPLYRFRVYLGQLAAGEDPGPCRIRKGDELWDVCDLINQVTEPIRVANAAKLEESTAADEPGETRRAA